MSSVDNLETPARFTDPAVESSALRVGCGLVDRSWIARLEICGADRYRFLNGLISSNVQDLEAGRNVYGFLTNLQGRVLADVYVIALEDRLWLELPPGRAETIKDHLEKYRVADRVDIFLLEDLFPLTLFGEERNAVLARAGAEPCPADQNRRCTVFGTELQLSGRRLYRAESTTLWVSSSVVGDVWQELQSAADAQPVGFEALEALRIENGVGRWGQDYDDNNLPQETGLVEEAVDFTKGCYLGQEIVARVHYLGQPSKLLQPLQVAGGKRPEEGSPLLFAEQEVGRLTSVAESPEGSPNGFVGLSVLKRLAVEAAAAGAEAIRLADGRAVALRESTG